MVKEKLKTIIAKGSGKGYTAVFDFDNTILCRDIGEATFAVMINEGNA